MLWQFYDCAAVRPHPRMQSMKFTAVYQQVPEGCRRAAVVLCLTRPDLRDYFPEMRRGFAPVFRTDVGSV
jgi:hypothetical protein